MVAVRPLRATEIPGALRAYAVSRPGGYGASRTSRRLQATTEGEGDGEGRLPILVRLSTGGASLWKLVEAGPSRAVVVRVLARGTPPRRREVLPGELLPVSGLYRGGEASPGGSPSPRTREGRES